MIRREGEGEGERVPLRETARGLGSATALKLKKDALRFATLAPFVSFASASRFALGRRWLVRRISRGGTLALVG